MDKPISVKINDLKNNLATIFNTCGLPAWVILYALDPLYSQLVQLKNEQEAEEEKAYEEAMKGEENGD